MERAIETTLLGLGEVWRRIGLAVLLAVAADLLFWQVGGGLTVPVFLALLCGAVLAANPGVLATTEQWKAAAAAGLGLAPLVEHVGLLSSVSGITGVAVAALIASDRLRQTVVETLADVMRMLILGPLWCAVELVHATSRLALRGGRPWGERIMLWFVPLGLGGVFAILFAEANPVISAVMMEIDFWAVFHRIDLVRVMSWLAVIGAVWSFLRVRGRRLRATVGDVPRPAAEPDETARMVDLAFGPGAILRGLIVFNAVFAVQTGLDLAYLWGGVRLPEGMTYAGYAHNGAYPLIAAALLAGGFTLAATREGSAAAQSVTIRKLAYLWTAQTVWLVVSSILRLDLYVEIYALTTWRVAAFIWMGLVGAGLVLIVARLALGKSNAWLVNTVAATGLVTLYALNYVNLPALIADHNVSVSREMGGAGRPLHRSYLCQLGPAALPAAMRFRAETGQGLPQRCFSALEEFRTEMRSWPSHTLRNRRTLKRLEQFTAPAAELGYRDLDNRAADEPWP